MMHDKQMAEDGWTRTEIVLSRRGYPALKTAGCKQKPFPPNLYRFSKIYSAIRKEGISGCRKKRSNIGSFY